ncbi:NGG1p interacting factor NIF3 [bacterium (Candidatus Gribaldobacteria) CG07_land_8_20_14_0_80_33_18]|uniref:NGG1p interacting factor NIF3 n=1 Tax=bacterium (Candidatus Gribaldobacteria) CG07_land_8_20_14_0_80_33_18 TaxID=2014272 RepID=A0A2M6Z445_9BACT|nr:MAG: NGG1p interacting factor NIF3 [bacterium (Candidatus Gribaldobacteria) CG10_big_fil_rev_8_21_14_0_10_33_41]PIU47105.1 MAG: NGG1p interacting factor NIF3 [bacterium (Candidatus Gribaldobacteria) CG07_land_8_20_14_0_80_33_18]PJA01049.1 MAG: NGG1p interacting factor NIF3 [bacterium (Candidatus Gribaldobacteria) CG_4_10_14_0_2_um_filter_33_15]PJB09016.1 MAG: NGG1p interacting factor NIF3 [bacterium (Candidatus Gribaldobacteria) CG_4_9_14_3_um_filter_33_9]
MKIKEIFNLALKMGIGADFRGEEGVKKFLERKREKYEKLPNEEKEEFDLEALENPYLDSRIHNISKDIEAKKVLIGIDIDSAELLVAKELGVDLVIAHHPVGKGLAALSEVMDLHSDVLNLYGVPINVAEGLMKERISEVARGVNVLNQQETVQTAKLLGINLINIHTPADNLAAKFLKNLVEKNKPERVEDLMRILKEVPEYKEATKLGFGPKISTGSAERRCGKIAIAEITGGTEGSPKLYEKMAIAGIGTILSMHQSEEHRKEAEAANINVVIAGHISSDSLGMNIFLDELEKEKIELTPCSGLIRISRVK